MPNDNFRVWTERDYGRREAFSIKVTTNGRQSYSLGVAIADQDEAERIAARLHKDLKPHADAEHDYYRGLED
jgi:hypothetical protein